MVGLRAVECCGSGVVCGAGSGGVIVRTGRDCATESDVNVVWCQFLHELYRTDTCVCLLDVMLCDGKCICVLSQDLFQYLHLALEAKPAGDFT